MKLINNILIGSALLSSSAFAQETTIIDNAEPGGFQAIEFESVNSHPDANLLTIESTALNTDKLSKVNYSVLAEELGEASPLKIAPSMSWLEKETDYRDFETGKPIRIGDLIVDNCLCIDDEGNKVFVVQSLDEVNGLKNDDFFNGKDNAEYIENLAAETSDDNNIEKFAAFILVHEENPDAVPIAVIEKNKVMTLFNEVGKFKYSGKLNEYTSGALLYSVIRHELFHSKDHIVDYQKLKDKALIETKAESVGFFTSSKEIVEDGMIAELQNFSDVFNEYSTSTYYYTDEIKEAFKEVGFMYRALKENNRRLLRKIRDPQVLEYTENLLDEGVDADVISRIEQGYNSLKNPYLFSTASSDIAKQIIDNPEIIADMDDDSLQEMCIKVASRIVDEQEQKGYFSTDYKKNIPENTTTVKLEIDSLAYDEIASFELR